MRQKRFEFILEAVQPIAHHSESFGNTSVLMRQQVRQPDGAFVDVPIITGDTMRHGLREASAMCLLEAAGLEDAELTEGALRLLFAGGMIRKKGSAGSTVDLGAYHEMCDVMPPLALLGGCTQNRMIPGRMEVDAAYLLCEEVEHLLSDWCREWVRDSRVELQSCRASVEEVQRVRMDPTLDPRKQKLLASGDREEVQGRLLASEEASAEGDHAKAEDVKSSMMPRRFERLVQGSLLWWSVDATLHSDLEEDTLLVMLASFLRDGRVGGKKGTGHGKIRPLVGRNVKVARFDEQVETLELSKGKVGDDFRDHVRERSDRIEQFLAEVVA